MNTVVALSQRKHYLHQLSVSAVDMSKGDCALVALYCLLLMAAVHTTYYTECLRESESRKRKGGEVILGAM